MANTNAPFGFRVDRNKFSSVNNYAQSAYTIATTNTYTFGFGDVVSLQTDGTITRSVTTDTNFLGIFLGCTYYNNTSGRWEFPYQWTGITTAASPIVAYVCDDINAVFTVQSSNTAITTADVGQNANFTSNAAPNTYSGISTAALDAGSLGTTNTLPFRIVGVSTFVGVDPTLAYNWVNVKFNATVFTTTTGQ